MSLRETWAHWLSSHSGLRLLDSIKDWQARKKQQGAFAEKWTEPGDCHTEKSPNKMAGFTWILVYVNVQSEPAPAPVTNQYLFLNIMSSWGSQGIHGKHLFYLKRQNQQSTVKGSRNSSKEQAVCQTGEMGLSQTVGRWEARMAQNEKCINIQRVMIF